MEKRKEPVPPLSPKLQQKADGFELTERIKAAIRSFGMNGKVDIATDPDGYAFLINVFPMKAGTGYDRVKFTVVIKNPENHYLIVHGARISFNKTEYLLEHVQNILLEAALRAVDMESWIV